MKTWESKIKETISKLDDVSNCMCLAKWLQVTIHLQNGLTHSCHHPKAHKIPLGELWREPSSLHNTWFKREQRQKMLKGKRPEECVYCWNIEDSTENSISDRVMKSSDDWALPYFEDVKKLEWHEVVNPRYLEVSFSHECNFKCAYCSPDISSSLMAEFEAHGPYMTSIPYNDVEKLKIENRLPYKKDEPNPYVEAFWNWWPNIRKDLRVFRITGGEPLLSKNTFKVLDEISKNPLPELELAVNTNFNVGEKRVKKFVEKVKELIENKKIRKFALFTSVDTDGKQAQFIRFGLSDEKLWNNMHYYMNEISYDNAFLTIMVAFNILSLPQFESLLNKFKNFRAKYHVDSHRDPSRDDFTRSFLDISYLQHPDYLNVSVADEELKKFLYNSFEYMRSNLIDKKSGEGFLAWEVEKLSRIVRSANRADIMEDIIRHRKDFKIFVDEYEKRKKVNFLETFPEFKSFYNSIETE